jgi:hypothetical protein
MPYEVQMYTSRRTWKTPCVYDQGKGVICDQTFETCEQAEAALDGLLADIAPDTANGLSQPWRRRDFRVTFVSKYAAHLTSPNMEERP